MAFLYTMLGISSQAENGNNLPGAYAHKDVGFFLGVSNEATS
jgi:hypothetical protein